MTSRLSTTTSSTTRSIRAAHAAAWSALIVFTTVLVAVAARVDSSFVWPNVAQIASSIAALALATRLVRQNDDGDVVRRWLLAGSALWYIADVIGLLAAALRYDLTWFPAVELSYLSAQTAWMIAALLAARHAVRVTGVRILADGAVVGATVAFAIWTLTEGTASSLERTSYGIATLAVDSVLLTSCVVITMNTTRRARTAWGLMAASSLLLLIADATFMYSGAIGDRVSGWVLDIGWTISAIVRCLAFWQLAKLGTERPTVDNYRPGHQRVLLPVVLVAVASVIFLRPPSGWTALSVGLMVLVLGSLGVRDFIAGVEQRRLAEHANSATSELRRRAETDELTGLTNRGAFFAALNAALVDYEATPQAVRAPTVAYLDLDRFKEVNDDHGHLTGDHVLRTIAARLRLGCTDEDVVARVGGDEFGVLRTTATRAGSLEDAIKSCFDEAIVVRGATLRVGVSVGVATATPGCTADELIANADDAAYLDKRARRPRRGAPPMSQPFHA